MSEQIKPLDRQFRDKLVSYIKDVGQDLIDRAEQMVGEDTDMIGDFHIDIDFDTECDFIPEISWYTTVACKHTWHKLLRGDY